MPFAPIVSSGPTAPTHAVPQSASSRPRPAGSGLGRGGGRLYLRLTRTFAIAKWKKSIARHQVVQEANAAGRAARNGGPIANVDIAARKVIEKAGMKVFHTPHGSWHRDGAARGPYARAIICNCWNPDDFTIEPGIYLPGRNGVRIEDKS